MFCIFYGTFPLALHAFSHHRNVHHTIHTHKTHHLIPQNASDALTIAKNRIRLLSHHQPPFIRAMNIIMNRFLPLSHCIAQLVENIFSQPTTMSTYVGRVEIINNKLYQNILKSPAVIIWRAYWFSSRNLYCFSSSSSSSACLCCCHLPLLLLTFQLNENFSKL